MMMSCKADSLEIERRVAHLKAFEKEFEGKEMWKKKYDWRCPDCRGLLMNIGGNIFKKNTKSGIYSGGYQSESNDFLMECLVCQRRYVSDDYGIFPVSDKDPDYIKYLDESRQLHAYLGFHDVETKIVNKWMVPNTNRPDRSYVKLEVPVEGIDEFEIAWCVLKQLAGQTGHLHTSAEYYPEELAEYNLITKKAFDAIELNKSYIVTVNIFVPHLSWWRSLLIYGRLKEPHSSPYVSSIKGLILEENRKGIDRRVSS